MNRLAPISRRRFLGTTAAALAASGPTATVFADAHGDTLRVRTPNDIVNVDPGFWQNTADLWTMDATLPKLINFKPGDKWEWELYCAESIEAVDAKTINFKVRPGFQWSDGYGELSAEDVQFSFERYLDTELAAPNGGNWALLSHVDVHDRYSGTIVFREPFSAVWWFVLPYATGSIVCKKAVEDAGGTYSLDPPAQGGPYKMVEHVPSQLIVLEAHSGWNGPKPDFKRVEFYPITDSKAAENAIQAGQLDVVRVSLSIVPHLLENMPEGLKMKLKSSPDNVWLGMNMAHPKLSDLRVRQAILKAIDVEAILEGAYFGVAERAHGPAGKGLLGYIDEPPPPRDVEGARALLAEAGVGSLDLVLDTLADTDFVTAGQIVQANLAEIGINLEIATTRAEPTGRCPTSRARRGWKSSSTAGSRRRTSTGPPSGCSRSRPASGTGSGTTARSSNAALRVDGGDRQREAPSAPGGPAEGDGLERRLPLDHPAAPAHRVARPRRSRHEAERRPASRTLQEGLNTSATPAAPRGLPETGQPRPQMRQPDSRPSEVGGGISGKRIE